MITAEVSEKADSSWNDRLLKTETGTIYQTKEYANYLASRLGSRPKFISFFSDDNELLAQLLIFESFKGRRRLSRIIGRGYLFQHLSKITSVLPKFYFWFSGPVIFQQKHSNQIAQSLGNLLKSWKVSFRGTQHPLFSNFEFPSEFHFKKERAATFIIDLKQQKDIIFKKTGWRFTKSLSK